MMTLKIKDVNGNWIEIPSIKGDKGEKGDDGSDYILTASDKKEIASIVLSSIPKAEEVSF